jgi:hypothetical protein
MQVLLLPLPLRPVLLPLLLLLLLCGAPGRNTDQYTSVKEA